MHTKDEIDRVELRRRRAETARTKWAAMGAEPPASGQQFTIRQIAAWGAATDWSPLRKRAFKEFREAFGIEAKPCAFGASDRFHSFYHMLRADSGWRDELVALPQADAKAYIEGVRANEIDKVRKQMMADEAFCRANDPGPAFMAFWTDESGGPILSSGWPTTLDHAESMAAGFRACGHVAWIQVKDLDQSLEYVDARGLSPEARRKLTEIAIARGTRDEWEVRKRKEMSP